MTNLFTHVVFIFLLLASGGLFAASVASDTIPVYSGNEVIEEEIFYESEDLDPQSRSGTVNPNCFLIREKYKVGIVCNGVTIIPTEYDLEKQIDNTIFIVRKDLVSGVYDVKSCKWVYPLTSCSIKIHEKKYIHVKTDSNQALYDIDGNEVLSSEKQQFIYLGHRGLFSVNRKVGEGNRKALFSAPQNRFVLDFKYGEMRESSNSTLLTIKDKNGYRVYDPLNEEWGTEKYEILQTTIWPTQPLWIATRDGLRGVVNQDGKVIIPLIYERIKELNIETSMVFLAKNESGKFDVFDSKGSKIEEEVDLVESLSFHMLKVEKGYKLGLIILKKGVPVIILPIEYDEFTHAYGITIVRKDKDFNVFCDRKTDVTTDLPYSAVRRLNDRTVIVTEDGFLAVFDREGCRPKKETEFTYFEDVKQTYPGPRDYNYMKAKKGEGPYYLTNSILEVKSTELFSDILNTKDHYIFYENQEGKIGVYNARTDQYDIEAIYDSMILYGKDILLIKDGKKGVFRNGTVNF